MTADPKAPARHKADKAEWSHIHELKWGPCRSCGFENEIELHHLVSRAQGGDDLPENVVPLCHLCHSIYTNKLETWISVARAIGGSMSESEKRYVISKKGDYWFHNHYAYAQAKWGDNNGLDGAGTDPPGPVEPGDPSLGPSEQTVAPGSTCPTCARRMPRAKPEWTEELSEKPPRRTWSVGIPVAERSWGADTIDSYIEKGRGEVLAEELGYEPDTPAYHVLVALLERGTQ